MVFQRVFEMGKLMKRDAEMMEIRMRIEIKMILCFMGL
jgi:hypothetical protein